MENMRSVQASATARRRRRAPGGFRGAALRLAVVAMLIGVLLGLLVPKLFAADEVSPSGAVATYVVSQGETLWDIAGKSDPGRDPRAFVHDAMRLNGLDEPRIFPGQRLILPQR